MGLAREATMDELDNNQQLQKLNAAYARIRVCGDLRRHVKLRTLEEIEQLEREALEAYEHRLHEREASS
jgi:hypothetical protein